MQWFEGRVISELLAKRFCFANGFGQIVSWGIAPLNSLTDSHVIKVAVFFWHAVFFGANLFDRLL